MNATNQKLNNFDNHYIYRGYPIERVEVSNSAVRLLETLPKPGDDSGNFFLGPPRKNFGTMQDGKKFNPISKNWKKLMFQQRLLVAKLSIFVFKEQHPE